MYRACVCVCVCVYTSLCDDWFHAKTISISISVPIFLRLFFATSYWITSILALNWLGRSREGVASGTGGGEGWEFHLGWRQAGASCATFRSELGHGWDMSLIAYGISFLPLDLARQAAWPSVLQRSVLHCPRPPLLHSHFYRMSRRTWSCMQKPVMFRISLCQTTANLLPI